MISDLASAYPDRFALVTAHVNGDGYETLWGQKRLDIFYGLTATVPSFLVDGEWSCAAGDYGYCVQSQLAAPTDVTLDLGASSVGGSTWDVTARICLEGGSSRTMRLYTAATLNDYPNPPTTSRNVLMQDVLEEDLTIPGGGCQTVTTRFTFDDQSMSNPSNIAVVAWVQAPSVTGPAAVYQAGIMRWPFPEGSRLTTIDISPASVALEVGGQVQLTATGRDQYGAVVPLDNPGWSLSGAGGGDGSFAPTSGSPVTTFTATAPGTRQVVCQDQGVSGTATVDIAEAPRLDRIVIAPDFATVEVGEQVGFTAAGFDQLGEPFPLASPAWGLVGTGTGTGSFEPAIGSTTTFTAISPGLRQVTCQDGSVTGTAGIEIVDPPRLTSLVIDPASVEVEVGGEVTFSVVGLDQHGDAFPLTAPVWSVSGEGHGTFDPATGSTTVFTADAVGSAVVSCSESGVEGQAVVAVVGDAPRLDSIIVTPATGELRVGESLTLAAAGRDQYGEPFALSDPGWRLEGEGDGVLDSTTGLASTFTATAEGGVSLICSQDGVEGAASVVIRPYDLPAPRKATRRLRP